MPTVALALASASGPGERVRAARTLLDRYGAAATLPPDAPFAMEAAMARAILHMTVEDTAGALALLIAALDAAPPGNAGWLIPVDPLLGVSRHATAWQSALARLRMRAV